MPGVKGRSGRRKLAEVPTGFDLPPLGEDESSVMAHLEALSAAVRTGVIDPRVGDTLHKVASAHLRAVSARSDRAKLVEKVNRLEAHLEEVTKQALAYEVATRQHARTGEEPAMYDEDEPKKN